MKGKKTRGRPRLQVMLDMESWRRRLNTEKSGDAIR